MFNYLLILQLVLHYLDLMYLSNRFDAKNVESCNRSDGYTKLFSIKKLMEKVVLAESLSLQTFSEHFSCLRRSSKSNLSVKADIKFNQNFNIVHYVMRFLHSAYPVVLDVSNLPHEDVLGQIKRLTYALTGKGHRFLW